MDFAISTGIRIVEVLFFAGCIGSLLVVVMSLIDFIRTFLVTEEPVVPQPPVPEEAGGS